MSSIISVQYQSKLDPEAFDSREYSYFAGVDLAVGDLVIAPTKNGDSIARVSAVDVPESKIEERVMPFLRVVEKKYESEEEPCQTQQ